MILQTGLLLQPPIAATRTSDPGNQKLLEGVPWLIRESYESLRSPASQSWLHLQFLTCFCSANFASCTLAMNAIPVRCWPRPSCRSCPIRRCSLRTYIQDRLFQVLSFRDVDTCGDDVLGGFSSAGKQGTRPGNQPLIPMPRDPAGLIVLRKKIRAQHFKQWPGSDLSLQEGETGPKYICPEPPPSNIPL